MNKSGDSAVLVAWTTVATRTDADRLAAALIESRLAGCVQIDAPITSVYHWDGNVERSEEYRLWIKTTDRRWEELETTLLELHPYDVPQLIAVSAEHACSAYAQWLKDCLT